MTVSITNWYTAGGKLQEIQEVCEAFQRGDRPHRTEQLTTEQVLEITETLIAIVEFCVTAFSGPSSTLKYRDFETYQYARNYGKTLARISLRREDVPMETKERMEEWLDREPNFPPIHVTYV